MNENEKKMNKWLGWFGIGIVFTIITFIIAMQLEEGSEEVKTCLLFFFVGMAFTILAVIKVNIYNAKSKNMSAGEYLTDRFEHQWDELAEITGKNNPKSEAELKQIDEEYEEAIASHQAKEPWRILYALEPCPYCGHYKVRNAEWEDKRLSVAFWGIASNKIGKKFKCEKCGKMW